MNFEQLQVAVKDAHRRDDQNQVLALMDQFLATAQGHERGHALCLKASYLSYKDHRRCAESLGLVEEALALSEGDPLLQMKCVVDGLHVCYNSNDPYRAKRYDLLGHTLVREYSADPFVRNMASRMYSNLALIAGMRHELTHAYWLLIQAEQMLLSLPNDDRELKTMRLLLYLRIADVCIELGRSPEAEDALVKAKVEISSEGDEIQWLNFSALYLRSIHDYDGAAEVLDGVPEQKLADRNPSIQVQFHLTSALVAQARGEIREFHDHLVKAQNTAVTHAVDFMLCRIQRVMRTPIRLEAAR